MLDAFRLDEKNCGQSPAPVARWFSHDLYQWMVFSPGKSSPETMGIFL
jgi:hypothetical protein